MIYFVFNSEQGPVTEFTQALELFMDLKEQISIFKFYFQEIELKTWFMKAELFLKLSYNIYLQLLSKFFLGMENKTIFFMFNELI